MASLFLPQWWISRREKGVSKCIHLLNDVYEVYSHSGLIVFAKHSPIVIFGVLVYLWLYNAPSWVSSLGSSLVRFLYPAKDGKSTLSLISPSAVPLYPSVIKGPFIGYIFTPITWQTFLSLWLCMILCTSIESTFQREWTRVQNCFWTNLWGSGLVLACFTSMATRIHACQGIHPATFLEWNRQMVKLLKHCGHPSITSPRVSMGCPLLIDRRYWMPIWTTLTGRRWSA